MVFSTGGLAVAQAGKEDITIVQSLFTKTKKQLISGYLQIGDDHQQAAFWRLYDAYESRRKAVVQERYYLLKEYATKYHSLDDESASELAEKFLTNTAKADKITKRYYKKFERMVGGVRAATLFQIELYIQTAMETNFHAQVPIIGELQKIKESEGLYHF